MKELPLVKGPLPWQAAYRLIRNPIPFLQEHLEKTGEIYRIGAPIPFVLITGPEMIRHVLHKNMDNYRKGQAYRNFSLMMGDGILNSEGEKWGKQRRMIQPAFDPGHLTSLSGRMISLADPLVKRWRGYSRSGTRPDVYQEMLGYATDVIGEFLMGPECSRNYKESLTPLMMKQYGIVLRRNRSFFKWPLRVPTPGNLEYFRTKKRLREMVMQIIRLIGKEWNNSITSHMLKARDDEGKPMSEEELVDEFLTLYVTGFETTGSGLSWAIILLARHPEVQDALWNEMKGIEGDREAIGELLLQSPYLNAVVREALRLYPPIWLIARESIGEDEIMGMRIPAKAHVLMCTLMAHRDARFWDKPDQFRPERFLGLGNHPAYLPFGAGPRMCIGKHFSHMEMISLLYVLCREFRFHWIPGSRLVIIPKTTLQPGTDPGIGIERR